MTCFTKRFVFLGLCAILFFGLIAILMLPMAARAVTISDAATVTLNVTNTPVRGDVLLEKTGLQLVRFEDEQDAYGNTVMRPVFQMATWQGLCLNCALPRTLWARKVLCSTARMS